MRNLSTYPQKTPVSPLRLIQDPGRGFILEIRMVGHHHRLALRHMVVSRERRVLVFRRQVGRTRGRVVALLLLLVLVLLLLHHVEILLLVLRMWLRVRWLRMLLLRRGRRMRRDAHRRRGGDVLRNDRGVVVHRHRVHGDALRWGVELVRGSRRRLRVVGLLREHVLLVRWHGQRSGRMVRVRVRRSGFFGGWSTLRPWWMRPMLVFGEGGFAAKTVSVGYMGGVHDKCGHHPPSFATRLLANIGAFARMNAPVAS